MLVLLFELALPNANDAPTAEPEQLCDFLIVPAAAVLFLFPKIFIVRGVRISAVVSVPKASVDKNGDFEGEKNEIRMSLDGIIPFPSFDAESAEQLDQAQLRRLVFLRLDVPHDSGAFFGGEYVHTK